MNNWIKSVFFACCIQYCYGQKNYVEITDFQKSTFNSQINTNTLGPIGSQLPNDFDAYTTTESKVNFSANKPIFRTDDGLLYLMDNDTVVINPENLVKGVGIDIYVFFAGRYYFDLIALNTNDVVIFKESKEKLFPRSMFQANINATNRTLKFGAESSNADIDKFIVSLSNPTNKIKKFSINNVSFIEKSNIETNRVTFIEGFTYSLQSNISGHNYAWFKDGQLLAGATNSFLKIDHALEGDVGQYVVQSGLQSVVFDVSFKRSITIMVNDKHIEDLYDQQGRVSVTDYSKVILIPFIEGLPIRYTLDGSEPTGQSMLYTGPFSLNRSSYIRAKIEIPETDSVKVKLSSNTE